MKELLKVIEVWKKAEEALNLSSEKGSYTDGFHKGYIHGMEAVKELLSSQPGVKVDANCTCNCYRVDDCPQYNSGDCRLKSTT